MQKTMRTEYPKTPAKLGACLLHTILKLGITTYALLLPGITAASAAIAVEESAHVAACSLGDP